MAVIQYFFANNRIINNEEFDTTEVTLRDFKEAIKCELDSLKVKITRVKLHNLDKSYSVINDDNFTLKDGDKLMLFISENSEGNITIINI